MGNPISINAEASSNPSEAKPTSAPFGDVNANGVVFGIRYPGVGGSNPGAK